MPDADVPALPVVIEGKPPIRAASFLLGAVSLFAGMFAAFLTWLTIPDWRALPIGLFGALALIFSAWMIRAGIRPTPAANRLVIEKDGLTVTHGTDVLYLAWRDIIDIKHARIDISMNDMIALYVSPEVALKRAQARTGGGNPNLVYLHNLRGFNNGNMRPLGRLIDRCRHACTGLPSLYLPRL